MGIMKVGRNQGDSHYELLKHWSGGVDREYVAFDREVLPDNYDDMDIHVDGTMEYLMENVKEYHIFESVFKHQTIVRNTNKT